MVRAFASWQRRPCAVIVWLMSLCLFLGTTTTKTLVAAHKHSENPMLLIVSFDGFRWDYLARYNLTNFMSLRENGSYADYLRNVFPTATFTNHWSIVTGLYPESHGIIMNHMYDPELNKTFDHTTTGPDVLAWYGQHAGIEPVWTTNQKAGMGRRSAAEWIGINAQFAGQAVAAVQYNHSTPFTQLVDQFMEMFTSEHDPINFGAIYFDEPDNTGHVFGPDASETEEAVRHADFTLGYLIDKLRSHHLYDKLNLIVTSDHGMANVSNVTAIYLEDYLDPDRISIYGSGAVYTVFLKQADRLEEVYGALRRIANIDVFKRADIPEELHVKNNPRTGDMLMIARFGYVILARRGQTDWNITKGIHGYETNNTAMYPIFLAHGPAFKKGHRVRSFDTVDLYPLMCHVLGVEPAPNNGSLVEVADILVHYFNSKLVIYTILSLVPVVLASATALFLCLLNRKYFDKGRIKTTNSNGYRILEQTESTTELNLETEETEE